MTTVNLINSLRKERGLPNVIIPGQPVNVTRAMIRAIVANVWRERYPRALTDVNFELGEFTEGLVVKEVLQRVSDLRRGVTVKKSRGT